MCHDSEVKIILYETVGNNVVLFVSNVIRRLNTSFCGLSPVHGSRSFQQGGGSRTKTLVHLPEVCYLPFLKIVYVFVFSLGRWSITHRPEVWSAHHFRLLAKAVCVCKWWQAWRPAGMLTEWVCTS